MENKQTSPKGFLSKVKKWLSHNSFLKVISVLSAFILWFAIVNATNPEVTVNVKTSVDVRNAEELSRADRIYTLLEKSVNISYKVRTGNRNLVKPSDFTAFIDLRDYSITGAVPVYIEINDEVSDLISDVSHDPLIVHVSTEDIIRRRFSVNGIVTGSASDGYVIGEIHQDPEVVYITGTSSDVLKIADVSFDVNADGAKEDIHGNEKIRLTDADGKKLNLNVKIEPYEYADYKLKIYKTKSLTVKATSEGLPGDGYVVDSIETSPTFISVYGEDSILDSTPYIFIPRNDINIAGATENMTFNLDINNYLPEGMHLNHGNSQLVVLVKIRSVMQIPEQNTTQNVPRVQENVPTTTSEPVTEESVSVEDVTESVEESANPAEEFSEEFEMMEELSVTDDEESLEESNEESTEVSEESSWQEELTESEESPNDN